jgi:hypothetical protein
MHNAAVVVGASIERLHFYATTFTSLMSSLSSHLISLPQVASLRNKCTSAQDDLSTLQLSSRASIERLQQRNTLLAQQLAVYTQREQAQQKAIGDAVVLLSSLKATTGCVTKARLRKPKGAYVVTLNKGKAAEQAGLQVRLAMHTLTHLRFNAHTHVCTP